MDSYAKWNAYWQSGTCNNDFFENFQFQLNGFVLLSEVVYNTLSVTYIKLVGISCDSSHFKHHLNADYKFQHLPFTFRFSHGCYSE